MLFLPKIPLPARLLEPGSAGAKGATEKTAISMTSAHPNNGRYVMFAPRLATIDSVAACVLMVSSVKLSRDVKTWQQNSWPSPQ
jgi:hypothetical protein